MYLTIPERSGCSLPLLITLQEIQEPPLPQFPMPLRICLKGRPSPLLSCFFLEEAWTYLSALCSPNDSHLFTYSALFNIDFPFPLRLRGIADSRDPNPPPYGMRIPMGFGLTTGKLFYLTQAKVNPTFNFRFLTLISSLFSAKLMLRDPFLSSFQFYPPFVMNDLPSLHRSSPEPLARYFCPYLLLFSVNQVDKLPNMVFFPILFSQLPSWSPGFFLLLLFTPPFE